MDFSLLIQRLASLKQFLLAPFLIVLILTSMFLVAGCVTTPTAPSNEKTPTLTQAYQQHMAILANIKAYSLKGRMGVVTQKQGFSGSIHWQHTTLSDNIDVFSPLGGKVANIAKNADGVTLTSQDGHIIKAQDAESLTQATLGFRLPLTGLSDWAIGKPTNNNITAITSDEMGRVITLEQDGWTIRYENYTHQQGLDLPNKIILKSDQLNLKLLIESWTNFSLN